MKPELFSIGHSNYPPGRFLALLAPHRIEAVVDIRRFPGSGSFPHFSRDNLAAALQGLAIEYHWIEALGGRIVPLRPEGGEVAPRLLDHNLISGVVDARHDLVTA